VIGRDLLGLAQSVPDDQIPGLAVRLLGHRRILDFELDAKGVQEGAALG
jgi:hypothetical protein